MQDAKYLKMTLSDNDFTSYFNVLGCTVYNIFYYAGNFPKEEKDLLAIKEYIARIWWSLHRIVFGKHDVCDAETQYDYIKKNLRLEIVDYLDIPEYDNDENIYIPLFKIDDPEVILV